MNLIYREDFKKIVLNKNKYFLNFRYRHKILDKLKIFYYLKNKKFRLNKKKIIKNILFLQDFFLVEIRLNFLKMVIKNKKRLFTKSFLFFKIAEFDYEKIFYIIEKIVFFQFYFYKLFFLKKYNVTRENWNEYLKLYILSAKLMNKEVFFIRLNLFLELFDLFNNFFPKDKNYIRKKEVKRIWKKDVKKKISLNLVLYSKYIVYFIKIFEGLKNNLVFFFLLFYKTLIVKKMLKKKNLF